MILNSKYNNFVIKFLPDFVPKEIREKYLKFIKRFPIPFDNVLDYLNFTIQTVSWPSLATETVEQNGKTVLPFKGGKDLFAYFNKEMNVTFKTTEGFLNYFILLEMLINYWSLGNTNDSTYVPDIYLTLLDHSGYHMFTYAFRDVVWTGISELELSYATNVPEYKTFDCSFKYKVFEIIQANG